MDLRNYAGKGYIFEGDLRCNDLSTGGFEELYLTGGFAPQEYGVPELATIALFGLGLFGADIIRRKRK